MNDKRSKATLRQRALESLEQSTKMLEVALKLFKQGNRTEAARIRDEARALRSVSVYLMNRANRVENSGNLLASGPFERSQSYQGESQSLSDSQALRENSQSLRA